MRDKYNGLYDYEAKTMPKKSNAGITTGYENCLKLASYKVSDFDTVVSENEHLIPSLAVNIFFNILAGFEEPQQ